ncbi:MAG TPA: hypothetical protein VKA89_06810 [Solirubrobacterales bacterium]|nr:hypothetical protein [Solirubrobacterales bacterium]
MDDQPTTPGGRQEGEPSSPLRPSVAGAAERIQIIVEAAERAAAGVIEDAEVQARHYLEESSARADSLADERTRALSEITDSLLEQANEVKRQSDRLIAALDEAKARLEEQIRSRGGALPGQEPNPPAPGPHVERVESGSLQDVPPAEEREAPHLKPVEVLGDGAQSSVGTPGARLLATQMAVAGSSRGEIERRLRAEFGIDRPEEMLDSILGPES